MGSGGDSGGGWMAAAAAVIVGLPSCVSIVRHNAPCWPDIQCGTDPSMYLIVVVLSSIYLHVFMLVATG